MDLEDKDVIKSLRQQVTRLAINMEKMKLAEYVDLLHSPWRLLWVNFTSGIARGLGIAVGFAILGAMVVIILKWLVGLNLPLIGGFIAQIVLIVQEQLKTGRY
ncbi:MAG: membrane protein [Peptococcaceae bacterium BRH_c4b]|nr:MAG: membrane protein [Peptococcaceae bacterium BRH_c4b]